MQAIVFERYGGPEVLELREVETPTPGRDEVLIRIRATTVTPSDVLVRSGRFPALFWLFARLKFGVFRPRRLVPAYELAGVIVAVGADVRRFAPGDEVFGASMWRMSCSAEYICLREDAALALKPAHLGFEEAVSLADGACTALHFLARAGVVPGKRVLVYGASGSVGSAAVQLAKHLGAEVTAVCSGANAGLARKLGADHVIDYRQQDFAATKAAYDVVFDAVGKARLRACFTALAPGGVFMTTRFALFHSLRIKWLALWRRRRAVVVLSMSRAESLAWIGALASSGAIAPVVDRVYPLADIGAAHDYVAQGHKTGNVVIAIP